MSCPRERRKAGDAANASRDSPRVLMNSHGALHLARVLWFVMCFPAFLPTQLLVRTLSTSYYSCSTDKETEAQKNYEAPRVGSHAKPPCPRVQRTSASHSGSWPWELSLPEGQLRLRGSLSRDACGARTSRLSTVMCCEVVADIWSLLLKAEVPSAAWDPDVSPEARHRGSEAAQSRASVNLWPLWALDSGCFRV